MTKKNKEEQSKLREKINETYEQNELDSIESMRHRARSITVGTAFGGIVEVNLRSDYTYLYAQMQPIEVIELIEQLAAGVGVEIAMRPKRDFSSWRGWEEVIEQRIGLDRHETYGKWAANVSSLRDSVREEIQLAKARGLRIAGYAATSKSTTVLNYCDLGPSDIEYIADLTPEKIGLVSPGKHIPIVGEDVFESSPPDIAFLFAWNHSLEIKKRLRWFEDSGGRWFTHVPLVSLR